MSGSNSGAGSQGSQNTAHLTGRAGTGAGAGSIPRQLKNGGSWFAQDSVSATSLDMWLNVPGELDPRIAFTRASTASYFDAGGTLRIAAANAPRWDFNPATLALNGLLIEEARTNILTNSQAINSWPTKTDSTIIDNSTTSPDGTANASLVTEGVAGTAVISSNTPSVSASAVVSYSAFCKRGNTDWIMVLGTDAGGTNGGVGWLNLTTGVSSFSNRGTGTGSTGSITPLSNGWYRIALTTILPATAAVAILNAHTATGNGATARVNNGTYYIWGAGIEVGSFPTSYIPTTAAAATRAADTAFIPNAPVNLLYGTLSVEGISFAINTPVQFDFTGLNLNGAGNDCLVLRNQAGTTGLSALSFVANVPQGGPVTVAPMTANAVFKAAFAYDAMALIMRAALNGTPAISLAPAALPANFNRIPIGITRTGPGMSGYYRRLRYWPRALSSAELQTVTT